MSNKYELIETEFHWFDKIPTKWNYGRVKNNTFVKARIGWQGMRSDEFVENTNWYCVTGTDFNQGKIDWDNCYCIDEWRYLQDKNIQLKLGDLLITKDGTIGKVAIVDYLPKKATLNSGVFVTRPINNSYLPEFFYWILNSNVFTGFIDYYKNGSTILHLYQNVFERFIFPLPSKNEQDIITNYLNVKTEAIDKKIELLTKKIDYYKQYKKSLMNDTVCKGLNKKNITKYSEYGFEVNNNYSPFRLKDLGNLYSGLSGKSGDDFNQNKNKNSKGFIPFTNIANNTYLKKDHLGAVIVYENENQNKVQKGDIFFLMSSEGYEDIGKTAILDDDLEDTYLNSFCKGYRVTNKKATPYFLNYLLLSDNYRKQLTIEGKGFTRINLKMEKVNDFKVYLPNSIEEQIKIVEFLDQKTQTIDKIVTNINKQIQTLKELRKTLINNVVTGKVRVTNLE